MTMNDFNLFSDEDLTEDVHVDVQHGWVRCLRVERDSWDVVNFEAIG